VILLGWLGCASSYGTAPYVVLRGTVDPAVVIDGNDAVMRAVWAVSTGDTLCVESEELDLVPYVTEFEVAIHGPPLGVDGDSCVAAPPDLGPDPVGFGVLTLVDPDGGEPPEVTASPQLLLEWFSGAPTGLDQVIVVQHGRLAAAMRSHVFIVHQGAGAFGDVYCRFDAVLDGLTLYEDAGLSCGGWIPVDPPGVRTEIQGLALVPPS
jgi:hypothetical protein